MTQDQNPNPAKNQATPAREETDTSHSVEDVTIVGTNNDGEIDLEVEGTLESDDQGQNLLEPGQKLGKYLIHAKLGQGGMGAVYLGFDPMIERPVAVKVLPPEIAGDPAVLDRFLAEAKAIGKLSNEHVVSIYDIGLQDQHYYIVMEFLKGGSLTHFIKQSGIPDWKEACRLTAEAAEGLSAAHHAGLIHRDIKPDNLMLNEEHTVKVVDFGLSKLLDAANDTRDAKTREGQILGTPQYMSPEQFQGSNLDSRSDIYSLGATFYTLLTGKLPFSGCSSIMEVMYAHLEQEPPDPAELVSGLPDQCYLIIKKAMSKKPEERYQDALELANELKSLQQAYGNQTTPQPKSSPLGQKAEEYRPLNSAFIVERSRMQAMVLMDAIKNSGVETLSSFPSAEEVLEKTEEEVPDLIVTSMQLQAHSGLELIGQLRENPKLNQTMLVLNSNDSTMEELIEAGKNAPLALVSKQTRAAELLRAVHAITYYEIPDAAASSSLPVSEVKTLVVSDADRLPSQVVELIRAVGLLDLRIVNTRELAALSEEGKAFHLALRLRTAGDALQDTLLYHNHCNPVEALAHLTASLQVDGEQVKLRAVRRDQIQAVTHCPLDETRLQRLLQLACQ